MTHVATEAKGMPGIWTTTFSHFGVQGLYCHGGHIYLCGLCCHWGTWWYQNSNCCWRGLCLLQYPLASRACVDVHHLSNHEKQCWRLGSGQTLEFILVSKNHTAARDMWIWMACHPGHLNPCCGIGPCVGSWPYHYQGLSWYPCLLIPPKAMRPGGNLSVMPMPGSYRS